MPCAASGRSASRLCPRRDAAGPEPLPGRLERARARLGRRHDRHAAARPSAQGPDGEEGRADERPARVAEQVGLRVPEALDEVAAEDAELVLEPLDALVAGADRHPDRERDDEDAADPRDPALADRLTRVRARPRAARARCTERAT